MKVLKLIGVLFLFCFALLLLIGSTGKDPMGPKTLGQETYPSSGMTRSRINLMGPGASSAAQTSDRQGLGLSFEQNKAQLQEEKMKEDQAIKSGPYNREGQYQFWPPH